MNTKDQFGCFERDITYDCHSLRARVSRSEAGKQIMASGPKVFNDLAQHLRDLGPSAKIEAPTDEVRHGWGILLSWICEEHSLDRKGIIQTDFVSWVEWVNDLARATPGRCATSAG